MSNSSGTPFFEKVRSFIASFFSRAFLSVILDDKICLCEVIVYKNGKQKSSEKKEFKTVNSEIPIEAQRYIKKIQRKYRFCYVSTIFTELNQGAIGITTKQEYERCKIELSDIEILSIGGKWSIYGYGTDIYEIKSSFESSGGVDFIFSPFALLHNLGNKFYGEFPKVFVLIQNRAISCIIADKASVKFGGYFLMHTIGSPSSKKGADEDESIDIVDDEKGGVEDALEGISLDEDALDELEDLGDLEELKEDDPLEDFQSSSKDKGAETPKTNKEELQ